MGMSIEQLESEIALLSSDERVLLAERILAFDPISPEREKAWFDEAERRAAAAHAGRGQVFDGQAVIAEARARIDG